MKNYRTSCPCPSSKETVSGLVYLVVQLFLLPEILFWINGQLSSPLMDAELNFVYYLINFMAMLVIFHDFLGRSVAQAFRHPIVFLEAVILGIVAFYALKYVTEFLIRLLVPSYTNYNDSAIAAMKQANAFVVLIGTVILVPPFEECIYRGVIFRNLYSKNHWAAYIVSIALFSMIHIIGYIGQYAPLELVMAFLQYLPAGLCLAWASVRGDTILAPIVIHAAVNYIYLNGTR